MTVPRCVTIATSDSGGGAGIQADLKAFAAAGCYGASVIVALTAQNTREIIATHELPDDFILQQLDAVFSDIGADAVKTGALVSAYIVDAVATFLEDLGAALPPLVVDPVMRASSGAPLLSEAAATIMVRRLFPLATIVSPNLPEAEALAGTTGTRRDLAERLAARGARAVLITGGHGDPIDHLFDGVRHTEISVPRLESGATHGSGCTHSATLTALLARGMNLVDAARTAAEVATGAVANGLAGIGAGDGPVDVLDLRSRR